MQKLIFSLILLLGGLVAAGAEQRSIALLGRTGDIRQIENEILKPSGLKSVRPGEWEAPAGYGKFAAVYIGEALPKGCNWQGEAARLLDYVRGGGTLILSGGAVYNLSGAGRNLSELAPLLGFAACPKITQDKYRGFEFTDTAPPRAAGIESRSYDWHLCSSMIADKLTSAKVLASYRGDVTAPALTVNAVGKGKVYWIGPVLYRLAAGKQDLGDADENGVFVLNEAGQSLEALTRLYRWIFGQIPNAARHSVTESSWGTQPLGEAGDLKYPTSFTKVPEFRPPQPVRNSFALSENGTAVAEIVAPRQFQRAANELKYHLDQITGGDFKITAQRTAGRNAIVFTSDDSLPPDTALAVPEGTTLTLGGNGAGPELALFYLLEKLGCRYLWPGKLGKVIPKNPSLAAPVLNLNQAPKLAVRQIRNSALSSPRALIGIKNCGFEDAEAVKKVYREALRDQMGNASFYLWHGQGGTREYRWGHSFGDYYRRFGKSNPEFFALQSNDSRSQEASPDRPRLCHSNMALVKQAADDCLETFSKNPNQKGVSIALPDGGRTKFCLCAECRELDPVNAAPATLSRTVFGVNQTFEYVALTDRVLTFSNRIAEAVTAQMPDRKLTMYAYSVYEQPPVKVKPHPALIVFCTAMSYTDAERREKALATLAAWSNLAGQLYWRPNALWGFSRELAPQNYARKIFEDTELLKANGLMGTDFDCNEQMWACKGLIYYALSKALWNPDRLSYDDIVTDYCRHGFGDAAPEMIEYFRLLEAATDRAAAEKLEYLKVFDEKLITQLRVCLERAEAKTSDSEIRERIRFVGIGLKAGEMAHRIFRARQEERKCDELQDELRQFIRDTVMASPMAINPGAGFRNPYFKKRN